MTTTTYTYDKTNRNLTFDLASSITINLQLPYYITFSLLSGTFSKGANSVDTFGFDNIPFFTVSDNLINGNFTINSSGNSTHDVTLYGDAGSIINIQQFNIKIGNGTVSLRNGITINASQTIDIETNKNISIVAQKLIAQSGIMMSANKTGQTVGIFNGIYVGSTTAIETTNGPISLDGHGGINGGTGIFIDGATLTNTNGSTTLNGIGGSGTNLNRGVNIESNSTVKGKGVTITGNGGTNATDGDNIGILVTNKCTIDADGNLVTLNGTGGSGTNSNQGVNIQFGSTVKGKGIAITGNGGTNATGTANHGVFISDDSQVNSANDVNIVGNSGKGSSDNRGVDIRRGIIIQSAANDVTIIGISLAEKGENNYGIRIDSLSTTTSKTPAQIKAGNKITLNGTGGTGLGSHGTIIDNDGIVSAKGITVTGKTALSSSSSYGTVQRNGGKFIGGLTINQSDDPYFPNTNGSTPDIDGDISVEAPILIKINSPTDYTGPPAQRKLPYQKAV